MTPPPPRGHTHSCRVIDPVDIETVTRELSCADPENCPQTRAVELLRRLYHLKVIGKWGQFDMSELSQLTHDNADFLASLESNSSAAGITESETPDSGKDRKPPLSGTDHYPDHTERGVGGLVRGKGPASKAAEENPPTCARCGLHRRRHVHNESCPYKGAPGEFAHHAFLPRPPSKEGT